MPDLNPGPLLQQSCALYQWATTSLKLKFWGQQAFSNKLISVLLYSLRLLSIKKKKKLRPKSCGYLILGGVKKWFIFNAFAKMWVCFSVKRRTFIDFLQPAGHVTYRIPLLITFVKAPALPGVFVVRQAKLSRSRSCTKLAKGVGT